MKKAETMGQRVRALRKARNLTQVELAAETELSRAHLAKIETDGDLPGRDALVSLSRFFGVSLDYLQDGRADGTQAVGDAIKDEREVRWLELWRRMGRDSQDRVFASLDATVPKAGEVA